MSPSSFAAAAAGTNITQSAARDGTLEWSRRPNGATQTFRRQSSNAPTSSNPTNEAATPLTARYVPPHRNGVVPDTRYSRSQLLDLYRAYDGSKDDVQHLYVNGWQPEAVNGSVSTAGWGRSDTARDVQSGPEICWDRDGAVEPLGLLDMDEEERELFSGSVNTPLKPPTQQGKENQQSNGLQSRKLSISQSAASPGGFGVPSPSTTRGGLRRRETSESYPFPNSVTSPTLTFDRNEQRAASPPASLIRRRTDVKESREIEKDDDRGAAPFGSLKRNQTGPLSAGITGPTSPWATTPQNNAFSPMGSFGNLGSGNGVAPSQAEKRTALGSGRAESRFKSLLQKDSSEDVGSRTVERKSSISSLHKLDENEAWRADRTYESLAEGDEEDELLSGSAALNANSDLSPSQFRHGLRSFDTPSRSNTRDDGFGAFGMTADHVPAFAQQTPAHTRTATGHEPMSPTDTNPYQSPEQHNIQRLHDEGDDDSDLHSASHLPGLGGFGSDHNQHLGLSGLGNFSSLGPLAGSQGAASDRSQTSSVGPARPFPGLGGLGQLGGIQGNSAWPASQGGLGARPGMGMQSPFKQGLFSPSNDLQSPNLSGIGGSGLLNHGSNAFPVGGRISSMFPQGMQDQMRTQEQGDSLRAQAFGEIGSGAIGQRDALHDQAFAARKAAESEAEQSQDSLPPAPQQRTMVMPDRMRWIYKDPQGQTQGPWSGLEMHDWYRAGFFSPELLVKKAEDADYEPLAQLIRRIGNSREPFLVPQIGIPHGAPSTQGPWAGAVPGLSPGAQPPFASSFPSFGTTLTAEQQNALERRKQEEQYLMARQKEHLAQAQIAQRMQQLQGPGHPGFGAGHLQSPLNHHSSAQSLHSQPSFGSMTSPSAYQQSPVQGPTAHGSAMFDPHRGQTGLGSVGAGVESLGHIREEEIPGIMDRLNLGRPNQFGAPGQPFAAHQGQPQNIEQMLQDRAMLQQEQADHDASEDESDEDEGNDRLHEFHKLQSQNLAEEHAQAQEQLSLTEQVQKAASAKPSPAAGQAPWARHEAGLPEAFPPPSQSPLPAPAAQRTSRPSVADQLHAETSRTQSPNVETPSAAIAPWAKEQSGTAKGPSLKEIQEMEAKKAAEAEILAAAARRAAMLKEAEAQALAAASVAAAPGLPVGANWAASPATPTNAATSPWVKAGPVKPTLTQTKSMAQIQKEEEARKKKLAAAQAQTTTNTMSTVANPAGGKSYANLAGKPNAITTSNAGGAWTTVGASGKTKTPVTPTAAPTRAVSSGIVPTVSASGRKPLTRSTTNALPGALNAQDEFRKWAVNELKPDLSKGISAEDFVTALISLGPDTDIITEAVHGSSNTIDSRHFAEEFIRRKKLADKGLVDNTVPPKSASPHNGGTSSAAGGWNEVAKKGPLKEAPKEENNGSFRVVAAKKKGAKR